MSESAEPITWEDVCALYRKMADDIPPPRNVHIIGCSSWDSMLAKSTEEEREALLAGEERGNIVISEFVPDYERRLRGE